MRRVVLAALVAAAGIVVFGAPARASEYEGSMANASTPSTYKFAGGQCPQPAGSGDFCITVGDSVKWTNNTATSHTVTGDSFGNGNSIAPGGTFTQPFNTIGTYPYHCNIHSYMTGTVNVSDTTPSSTTTTTHVTTTTSTTAKPTTTTTSTTVGPTTTTEDINGVFGTDDTTPTEPTTTVFSTDTTRALGQGGGDGTSAGVIAALIVGLGGIGTAVALVIRRMRAGAPPA